MKIPINQNAPVRSEATIEISAPVHVVWRVLTTIDDWPKWQADVTESALQGELKEGAEFKWKAGGIRFRSKIHTMLEPTRFGWTGKTVGASAIHNWALEERNGGTSVRVEESLEGWLPTLFKTFFQKKLDRGVRKNLEELRSASENDLRE